MTESNKKALVIAAKIVGVAAILYLILRRKQPAVVTQNVPGAVTNNYIQDPVQAAWNPGLGFQPSPQNIDVNIGNQGFNYLTNKYIPLFGFVGMAQGETYH